MEWRDIPGYEGRYQVSDEGQVRSRARGLMTPQLVNSGYYIVQPCTNGKRATCLVHRLVALAFIAPDLDRPRVNHKDGDKHNNHATNLEWATDHENMAHARDHGLLRPCRRAVIGVSLLDASEIYFKCQRDAEIELSGTGKQSSAVNHCLNGKKHSAYGYVWRRA